VPLSAPRRSVARSANHGNSQIHPPGANLSYGSGRSLVNALGTGPGKRGARKTGAIFGAEAICAGEKTITAAETGSAGTEGPYRCRTGQGRPETCCQTNHHQPSRASTEQTRPQGPAGKADSNNSDPDARGQISVELRREAPTGPEYLEGRALPEQTSGRSIIGQGGSESQTAADGHEPCTEWDDSGSLALGRVGPAPPAGPNDAPGLAANVRSEPDDQECCPAEAQRSFNYVQTTGRAIGAAAGSPGAKTAGFYFEPGPAGRDDQEHTDYPAHRAYHRQETLLGSGTPKVSQRGTARWQSKGIGREGCAKGRRSKDANRRQEPRGTADPAGPDHGNRARSAAFEPR